MSDSEHRQTTKWTEYVEAFLDYLRRPKTVFDFKDRLKALCIFIVIVLFLEILTQLFVGL